MTTHLSESAHDLLLGGRLPVALAVLLVHLGVEADALAEREAVGVGVRQELLAHLGDDLGGGLADRDHGEGSKQERKHGAGQDARQHNRVTDVVIFAPDLLLEGCEE